MLTKEDIKERALEIAKNVKLMCGEGELLQEVVKLLENHLANKQE